MSTSEQQPYCTLITGASAGIGEATAWEFAKDGSNLILVARREEKLKELKKSIEEAHPSVKVHIAVIDVTDRSKVNGLVSTLPDDFKVITHLVLNAGLALGFGRTWENEPEHVDQVLDVNVKGYFNFARAIIPAMVERNYGDIIVVSSIAGFQAYGYGSLYCASKHATQAIGTSLRKELISTNLRVCTIQPGLVETEFSIVRNKGDKDKAAKTYANMKPLVAKDIAEVIIFSSKRPRHVQLSDVLILPTNQASVADIYRAPVPEKATASDSK